MDSNTFAIIGTGLGTGLAIITFVYTFLRNFKDDVNNKIETLDERMFLLATGKSLQEAILEDKIRKVQEAAKVEQSVN